MIAGAGCFAPTSHWPGSRFGFAGKMVIVALLLLLNGYLGYFDVKCFDAQASACAQYLKAGREVAVDGRLLFDEFQTQEGSYASRIYIVAERVEFLASRKPSNGQASDEASPDQPATHGAAREAHPAA